MKNFNRRSPHVHHGSKRRKLAQRAHSRGSHAFTHTLYINTFTTTLCEPPAQLLNNLEFIILILKVPEGGGANRRSTRGNPPTACSLIGIT